MYRTRIALALSSIALILLAASPLSAAFVAGQFAPGGTTVRVSSIDILFYHLPGFVPPACPGTGSPACSSTDAVGNLIVQPPTTSTFTGRAGETGAVKNLTRNPVAEPNLAYAPTDVGLSIDNWLVLPNAPSITFRLTTLTSGLTASAGTAPICNSANWNDAGYRCTPDAASPFLLTNVQTFPGGPINTDVSMSALGLAWFVATPGEKSNAVISLITTRAAMTIGDVLTQVSTQGFTEGALGGSIVVTPIPEPATFALSGAALLAIGLFLKKGTRR